MKVLVVGNGGREHALAWKLSQSSRVTEVICAPGNPGMAAIGTCFPQAASSVRALADLAQAEEVTLTVVGPEAWLSAGIVDEFTSRGLRVFGPTALAAEIESSKVFSKDLMKKYGIPTAAYEVFSDVEDAFCYIDKVGAPVVVKADGLAAGKGAVVCFTTAEAKEAVSSMVAGRAFGAAGLRVVIEEFMEGYETSLLAFTDGHTILPMAPAQDHKRAFDGDEGPNTGGMGAYSPVPQLPQDLIQTAMDEILIPTIRAMETEGRLYKGVLYAGLMLTAQGPKVVEFNARFGDPETQVILPRLKTDLVDVFEAVVDCKLSELNLVWCDEHAACVVMASGGYPGEYQTGFSIEGISKAEDKGALVFHAGTKLSETGQLVAGGGRVLNVVGMGATTAEALKVAYNGAEVISFQDNYYRKDIGWQVTSPVLR